MSKEMWLSAYECVTEEIMEEKDVEFEKAREILDKIIEENGDTILCDHWNDLGDGYREIQKGETYE